MILPILFVLGLAYLGYRAGEAMRDASISISGNSGPWRAELAERISEGDSAERWLVNEAMREALEDGDMETVADLSVTFPTEITPIDVIPGPESQEPAIASQKQIGPSPLEGVADDDWADFVERLRTQPAGFASEKYIGQFEQNRGRLAQLELPEPTTPEQEYATMVQDLSDRNAESGQLISDYSGEVVDIGEVDHPVTWSGILGLIKCAGPEGARGWLTNPSDREKFPHTTEMFVRCNGCF